MSTSASSPSKSNFHKQTTDTAGAGLAFAILHVEGLEPQKFQQTIRKTSVEMKPNWSTGHCPHQHRLPRDLELCWSVVAGCVANHLDHSWSFIKLGGGFVRSTTPQSIRHKIMILSLWPFFKRKKNTLCCANLGMLCRWTSYLCWISFWNYSRYANKHDNTMIHVDSQCGDVNHISNLWSCCSWPALQ